MVLSRKKTVAAALIVLFPALSQAAEFHRTRILFENVPVSLTVRAPRSLETPAFSAMENAFTEAERLGGLISEWRPASQTSLLNRSAGRGLRPIGPELFELLTRAREISEKSGGAFDVTFASPKPRDSCHDIRLDRVTRRASLSAGTRIGVSGIAKGFIVDAMSASLNRAGFGEHLVNAGDLYAAGRWKIRIRDPRFPSSDKSVCTLWVKNKAVSTSGQYERGPHILDPKNHRPIADAGSVTVVAEKSVFADAWAKAVFVSSKNLSLLEGLEIIRVDADGKVQGCPN